MNFQSNKKQMNAVIGFPLLHTKTPLLHRHIYQSLGVNAEVKTFASENIEAAIHQICENQIALTAVTAPHKETCLSKLDYLSDEVKMIGAANTIIFKNNKLFGYNTDVHGLAYALQKIVLKNKKCLIVGAGGAARSVGYLLKQQGAELFWLNRTKERVENIMLDFGGLVYEERHEPMDIIFQTTTVGMFPSTNETPLPDYSFQKNQIAFDLIYNPKATRFIKDASFAGATIISGLDMFVGQAIKQVELWLDIEIATPALIQELKKIVEEDLSRVG